MSANEFRLQCRTISWRAFVALAVVSHAAMVSHQSTGQLLVKLGGEANTARASDGRIHQLPNRGQDCGYRLVLYRGFLV